MQDESYVQIPLRGKDGSIRAYALVDHEDAHYAEHRWQLTVNGRYASRTVVKPKRMIYLHRAIMGLGYGDKREVDHINRTSLDCRRGNLRIVTRAQNMQNVGSLPGATSKYRGVYWCSGRQKWAVQVAVHGRKYHLGRFTDELEAAAVARAFIVANMPFATEGVI